MTVATLEEMEVRAREVPALDKDLHRQLQQLFVEKGTLQQLVRAIYDLRQDVMGALAGAHMTSDDMVKMCIGLQGQVQGINNVLGLIFTLMQKPNDEEEEEKS
jgi:hypothetical protein